MSLFLSSGGGYETKTHLKQKRPARILLAIKDYGLIFMAKESLFSFFSGWGHNAVRTSGMLAGPTLTIYLVLS